MLIAKAESHLSHMKRDLNFLNQIQMPVVYIPYCLLSDFFPVICLFWQTLTSRDDTHTQEIRAKITSLDSIFFAGETSRALALSLTFTAGNINNLPLELSHLWKKLSSTCRQVYISKNISRLNLVKQFRTVHSPSQVHRFFGVGFFFYLFPPLRALRPQ